MRGAETDFMGRIPDCVPLWDINIPGSHDSATAHISLALFSRCQSMTIGEQLEAGCRFLDLRLSGEDASLPLVHGIADCRAGRSPFSGRLLFARVLEECLAFLDAHPSEAVIACVKSERHGGAEFVKYFYDAISARADRWFLESRMPSLGEVRGRLVLVRRFDDPDGVLTAVNGGLGLLSMSGDSSEDGAVSTVPLTAPDGTRAAWARVQDKYRLPPKRKWEACQPLLNGAAGGGAGLNFLSTAWLVCPRLTASVMNRRFMSAPLKRGVKTGITSFDFFTREAAGRIIASNDFDETNRL